MEDVQSGAAQVAMPIDQVGIRGFRLPLLVRGRAGEPQRTVARVEATVDLSADARGTHMSRFVQALEAWDEPLDHAALERLLHAVKAGLHARRARVILDFPYFVAKAAPVTGHPGLLPCECRLVGELETVGEVEEAGEEEVRITLEVLVPVMTVCPCSKAISREGAHSQRADVRLAVRADASLWIEDWVERIEASASSPVYSLLKREDEKFVTETAFSHPTFVEDVARNVAQRVADDPRVSWFRVEVESQESIHAHNACALIERNRR